MVSSLSAFAVFQNLGPIAMLFALPIISISQAYSCPVNFVSTIFANVYSSNYGGAIYISVTACNLTISKCLFSNTSCVSGGGAIYFSGAMFSCQISCFYNCLSRSGDSAIYCSATNVLINQSEASLCTASSGTATIEVYASALNYSLLNDSMNYASDDCSGIFAMSSVCSYGSLSSFLNNTDNSEGATIDIQGAGNPQLFSYNNYIGNRPTDYYGFIWLDTSAKYVSFSKCLFVDNGGCTFVKLGSHGSPSYPTFTNCVFDIAATRLSGCSTFSCSFNVAGVTTIGNFLLNHNGCFALHSDTAAFTSRMPLLAQNIIGFAFALFEFL